MYEFSRGIAQRFTDIGTALDEMKGIGRGKLNISVTSTAEYFAPYLLAAFCRQHAGITVSLDVINREALLRQLADNIPDMTMLSRFAGHISINWIPAFPGSSPRMTAGMTGFSSWDNLG